MDNWMDNGKPNILSLSGGKDSTCLLLLCLEAGITIDHILFCDTGLEFPEMYEHLKKLDKYIQDKYGAHITVLHPDNSFNSMLLDHVITRGKWKGMKGMGWPTFLNRWCTKYLKLIPVRHFLASQGLKPSGVNELIGIAADEQDRVKDKVYPLIEWGYTEKMCLDYCYSKGFDWGGLYNHCDRVSCWLCPLQSMTGLKTLYAYHRDLWDKLVAMDDAVSNNGHKHRYHMFHKYDVPIAELEKKFEKERQFWLGAEKHE